MTVRRFWVELAHPAIRFGCYVTAKSADEALAILRDVIARGDVVVGEDPERVAAIAEKIRRQGEYQPPSANDGTTAATS
jgi:predicted nucleic acid-binding protein